MTRCPSAWCHLIRASASGRINDARTSRAVSSAAASTCCRPSPPEHLHADQLLGPVPGCASPHRQPESGCMPDECRGEVDGATDPGQEEPERVLAGDRPVEVEGHEGLIGCAPARSARSVRGHGERRPRTPLGGDPSTCRRARVRRQGRVLRDRSPSTLPPPVRAGPSRAGPLRGPQDRCSPARARTCRPGRRPYSWIRRGAVGPSRSRGQVRGLLLELPCSSRCWGGMPMNYAWGRSRRPFRTAGGAGPTVAVCHEVVRGLLHHGMWTSPYVPR